jgi:hypothetical protein
VLLTVLRRFRDWRTGRPFWGGALTVLSGVEILWAPLAPLDVVLVQGLAGVASLVIAALLVAMGVLSWCQPHLRSVLGVVTVVLSLASFLTSNLGGFLVGMVLGLVGGSLVFGWTPRVVSAAVLVLLAAAVGVPSVRAAPVPVAAGPVAFSAASMAMTGLAYGGVVDVPTASGPVRALRFTMDTLTIDRTRLVAPGLSLRNPRGAATLTGGVELYTTSISGLLFGVIPVLFTPRLPPPFIPPSARFTLARATIWFLRADHAHLPTLREAAT